MIADLVDGVVQPLERIADPLPGQLSGLACGRVYAEPDLEQAADYPVQQVFGVLRLLREHGTDQVDEVVLGPLVRGVPDHGEDEMLAGGRDWAQRDRHRMVLPSLRSPTSRARSAIGRAAGFCA